MDIKLNLKRIFLIGILNMLLLPIGVLSAPLAGSGTVIITFDDGWKNTFDMAKGILDNNNQKAVVFVIPQAVIGADNDGWADYMTTAQLQTLYNNGWDISSHSYTHGSAYPDGSTEQENYLINANNTELKFELGNSKDWLDANGFRKSSMFFAYPFGAYNDNLVASIKVAGYYIGARTVDAYSWRYGGEHPKYNLDDADVLKMATLSIDNTANTYPSKVLDEINKTVSENGLLVITFHKIVPGNPASAMEYNLTNFSIISDYLKTISGNVKVTTFSEYFQVPDPIPTYDPPTPSARAPIIGKDWILTQWEPGDGNKTDVFDVKVNGVMVENGYTNMRFKNVQYS